MFSKVFFSKAILVFIGLVQLMAGSWAVGIAFADTTQPISSVAMMGMFGSLFHSCVLFIALRFRAPERRMIALMLPVWHIPETILIATMGMGVPEEQQMFGIMTHAIMAVLALVSWRLEKSDHSGSRNER